MNQRGWQYLGMWAFITAIEFMPVFFGAKQLRVEVAAVSILFGLFLWQALENEKSRKINRLLMEVRRHLRWIHLNTTSERREELIKKADQVYDQALKISDTPSWSRIPKDEEEKETV